MPVWHSGLSRKETADKETDQKVAMKIFLKNIHVYINYQLAFTKSANCLFDKLNVKRNGDNIDKEYSYNFGRYTNSTLPLWENSSMKIIEDS